jgi:hypothetical protein
MIDEKDNKIFLEKQKENFVDLALIFSKIHQRLAAEGYKIENKKIIPPKVMKFDRM